MSRRASVFLSWFSSFAVAYLVGARLRDRRSGLLAGLGAATFAAIVSWAVYGVVELAERGHGTEGVRPSPDTGLDAQ